jgi:hypothetical protein
MSGTTAPEWLVTAALSMFVLVMLTVQGVRRLVEGRRRRQGIVRAVTVRTHRTRSSV